MPRDHTVALHGLRFHYTERGEREAPVVVMLHGVTGHARTWDDEGAALASRYRVLALDQRGHGDSDPQPNADYTIARLAADLAAFADALGLATFTLCGLSLGGRVGIQYAGTHPARVSRLVVVDIGPDLWPAWRAIACPTLLVRGAESDILSPEIATTMVQAQPRARFV